MQFSDPLEANADAELEGARIAARERAGARSYTQRCAATFVVTINAARPTGKDWVKSGVAATTERRLADAIVTIQ